MKKYVLLGVLLVLGACGQGNKEVQTFKQEKQIDQIQQNQKEKLTKWDESIISLALKKKDISICKKVKNIQIKYCKKIYDREIKKLKNLDCGSMKYLKNECEQKLAIKNKDCEKIQDRAEKIKCQYEKDLKKALKENNQEFCKKLPFSLKNECEQKFK